MDHADSHSSRSRKNSARPPKTNANPPDPPADPAARKALVLELLARWRESVLKEEELRLRAGENEAAGRAIDAQASAQNDVICGIQDRLGALAVEWFGRRPVRDDDAALAIVVDGRAVLIESSTRGDGTTIGLPIAPADVLDLS